MRKIVMWLLPLVLFGGTLFLPAVTVAALTPPTPIAWQQTISDGAAEFLPPKDGMDISSISHAYGGGAHYFQMELFGKPGGPPAIADSYTIFIKKAGSLNPFDYSLGYNNTFTAAPNGVGVFSTGGISVTDDGNAFSNVKNKYYLEWKTAEFAGGDQFTFWGVTSKGFNPDGKDGYDIAGNAVGTPIPGAAYLLGSGVIGLVGLRRRKAKKS